MMHVSRSMQAMKKCTTSCRVPLYDAYSHREDSKTGNGIMWNVQTANIIEKLKNWLFKPAGMFSVYLVTKARFPWCWDISGKAFQVQFVDEFSVFNRAQIQVPMKKYRFLVIFSDFGDAPWQKNCPDFNFNFNDDLSYPKSEVYSIQCVKSVWTGKRWQEDDSR